MKPATKVKLSLAAVVWAGGITLLVLGYPIAALVVFSASSVTLSA